MPREFKYTAPLFALTLAAVPLVALGCHNTTNGDAETSGQHAGDAVRDAGSKAVDGVKSGGEKAGHWVKGAADGVTGNDGG